MGIDIDGMIADWYSLSINNCPKDKPQARKYSDSYKLLIGKCPEIDHLNTNCSAIKKLTKILSTLTVEDGFLLKTDIKEIGKLTNNKKNTIIPKVVTGSYMKFWKKS